MYLPGEYYKIPETFNDIRCSTDLNCASGYCEPITNDLKKLLASELIEDIEVPQKFACRFPCVSIAVLNAGETMYSGATCCPGLSLSDNNNKCDVPSEVSFLMVPSEIKFEEREGSNPLACQYDTHEFFIERETMQEKEKQVIVWKIFFLNKSLSVQVPGLIILQLLIEIGLYFRP